MSFFVIVVLQSSSSSSSLLVLLSSLSLLSSSSSLSLSSLSSSSSSSLVSIASNGSSQATSPPQVQHCWSTNQCNRMLGHTCQRLYEGCELGICMCAPGKQVKDTLGRCLNVRYGGEECHPITDVCPQRMNCSAEEDNSDVQPSGKNLLKRCRCDGKLTLTDDRRFCIDKDERILGQTCQSSDTCLHLSTRGYTRFDVKCSTDGVCECNEGFRREGVSCKKVRIGGYGCRATHHCDRGAVCNFQMKCVCPLDYVLVAGGSKCAKRGAIFDLPFGSTCDEINERKYCSKKHICYSCSQQVPFRCVRFLLEEEYSYLRSQSPVTCLSSILMTSSVYVTLFAT